MQRRRSDCHHRNVVSVLFNEPKLLKSFRARVRNRRRCGFSALQRAEIAEIGDDPGDKISHTTVSVLFNEPKLLKSDTRL